jgi:hypothetical protein
MRAWDRRGKRVWVKSGSRRSPPLFNTTGIALLLGALAGPLLKPNQQPDMLVRAGLAALGFGSLPAQVILGYAGGDA